MLFSSNKVDTARLEKKLPKFWWWTEYDKAKTHSEDNATPMPLTVTRLTRWKRIDAFERDTAGAANQSVLKVSATAIEEVKDSTKKHAVIPNEVTEEVTVELKKKLLSSLIES
jgi:hypothetical protein